MEHPDWPTGLPLNFGGLGEEFASLERARAIVLPVPYDFSTTYQGGTRWGPRAILSASQNMELWDDELGATYRAGIHTLPEVEPEAARVEQAVGWILDRSRLPVVLGGEHSITAGAVRATAQRFGGLSVLQFDAHADMRDSYLDSPYSHACVMRRVREHVPAASVGIRSCSEEEAGYLREHPVPIWSPRAFRALQGDWGPILSALTDTGMRPWICSVPSPPAPASSASTSWSWHPSRGRSPRISWQRVSPTGSSASRSRVPAPAGRGPSIGDPS